MTQSCSRVALRSECDQPTLYTHRYEIPKELKVSTEKTLGEVIIFST